MEAGLQHPSRTGSQRLQGFRHGQVSLLQLGSFEHEFDTTTSHGTQGILNTASKGTLENEFNTANEDEILKQILQKGELQTTQVRHDITRPDSITSIVFQQASNQN